MSAAKSTRREKVEGIEGLYRSIPASGGASVYYARVHWREGGKKCTNWKSLKTDKLTVAKNRLRKVLDDHKRSLAEWTDAPDTAVTFEVITGEWLKLRKDNISLSPGSLKDNEYAIKRLYAAAPDLPGRKVKSLRRIECEEIARVLMTAALRKPPHGSNQKPRLLSPSAINKSLIVLNQILSFAANRGIISANPAQGVTKPRAAAKRVNLPTLDNLKLLLEDLERAPTKGVADFASGLAFTGRRISELRSLKWGDVYWERNQLHIQGTKSKRSDRLVPLIPPAKKLLEAMHAKATETAATAPIFTLQDIEKSLTASCKRLEIDRLTHHDFRHFFVTMCIEAGIDFRTISEWVGHSDGGILVAKTYGHLRDEHSQAAALKVNF